MNDFYEELWGRLPELLVPPDLELRRRFLLGELAAGDRVLDLGCGEGQFASIAMAAGARQVIGAEVAQSALERAARLYPELDLRLVPIDGPLPFADGAFELVWASEVIEHVADTAGWLSEVRRVLAPRGRLLLTTPDHGRLRLLLGGIARYSDPLGDHLHLYVPGSLRDLLRGFGFDPVEITGAGGTPLFRRVLMARAVR